MNVLCKFLLCLSVLSVFSSAQAESQKKKYPVHLFNAHLLSEDENMISWSTNYYRGVSDTLNVGANLGFPFFGICYGVYIPNLNIKYELFDLSEGQKTHKISVVGWGGLLSTGESSGLAMGEFLGITDSFAFAQNNFFNIGIYHLRFKVEGTNSTYVKDKADAKTEEFSLQAMAHWFGLGYDSIVTENFNFHGSLHLPLRVAFSAKTDSDAGGADLGGSLNMLDQVGKKGLSDFPIFYMLSFTNTFNVFNIEYGFYGVNSTTNPIISLFWRW